MRLDIIDINEFIKENHCKEVTDPIFFMSDGTYTPSGLFSYDIFGITEKDRKNRFGYINLNDHFIHPVVYTMLNGRMGAYKSILRGEKYAIVEGNHRIKYVDQTEKGALTGTDFFYANFEKFDWMDGTADDSDPSDIDSIDKRTRVMFLKSLAKNEMFVDKWLVLPPYYRAENSQDRTMGDDINKLYKELINRSAAIKKGFGFQAFGDQTKQRIQQLLEMIYEKTMMPITGKALDIDKPDELKGAAKFSMFRKHMLGKAIDWSVLNVITANLSSDCESVDDSGTRFGYGNFPLMSVVSMAKPFFINSLTDFYDRVISFIGYVPGVKLRSIDKNQYSADVVDKMLDKYIKSEYGKFDPITVSFIDADGKQEFFTPKMDLYGSEQDAIDGKNPIEHRPMTITDLVFMNALDIVADKHAYVTRYPVTNFQNIYPTRMNVMSTIKTRDVWVRIMPELAASKPIHYKQYPYVKYAGNPHPMPESYYEFVGVFKLGNWPLKSIGGDFDGDTVIARMVFSKEANSEADKLAFAKSNVLLAAGQPARSLSRIGKDCVIAIYEMTKDE
jgi:hypothetical protein